MNRKLLLAIDNGTPAQNDIITLYLRGKGWHVWHWIADVWLLAGVPASVSPKVLWDELLAIPTLRGSRGLVMEIEGDPAYWGGNPRDAWEWLGKMWGKPDLIRPIEVGA